MEKEEKIIELIGVEKVFDGQTAVENLNLYVRKGEFGLRQVDHAENDSGV